MKMNFKSGTKQTAKESTLYEKLTVTNDHG
jgi:hypothetical protein